MTTITYEQMYDILRELGFVERQVRGAHVSFAMNAPPVTILLPQMRANLHVKPVHLRMVVHQLVERGIVSEDGWDQLVRDRAPRRQAANQ
jgi:predicted RNA binding protein YcfA (HicA-like mRNA interferase family)